MITLRGKLTRTLVEAKPVTPAITRSNLTPSESGAEPVVADGAVTQPEADEAKALVEEWIWRGVWAFGSLPEEDGLSDEEKVTDDEATGGEESSCWSQKPEEAAVETQVDVIGEETKEGTEEDTSPETAAAAGKPRPFCYRFIKHVDANDVIVPSSLVVVQEDVDHVKTEHQVEASGETAHDASNDGEKNDQNSQAAPSTMDVTEETKPTASTGPTETAKTQSSDKTQSHESTQNTDATSSESANVVMSEPQITTMAESENDAQPPTSEATPPSTQMSTELPPNTKQTYGDQPYTPANLIHPTPPGGKWDGHFENIVPNTPTLSKKRRDKRDNRIREVFYLFFNATPPKDAKTAFVAEDSAVVANETLDESGTREEMEEEKRENDMTLPKGRVHVRGYGTNRFGTFEIVGSLDWKSGMLHCQRMYVETPPPMRESRKLSRNSTGQFSVGGRRGRPPSNHKDGEGGKRGRKRKPSLKKRTEGIEVGNFDIASSIKKRTRMSVDSGGGDTPIGMPQCRTPSSKGSGGKGSKKKKAPAQSKEDSIMQFVQPTVDIPDPLPSDGDPLLARWRAAHYLYYQREEIDPEDGEGVPTSKVSIVVYEGEMVDGYRDGMGICLYDNDTMYEGQWRKNKEHGKGTLMTPDRSKIIYEGDWERGRMHGSGSYSYHKDLFSGGVGHYVGEFRENLRSGKGTYTFPDGSSYDGEWKENIPNGWGLFRWPDNSLYEGFWKNGCRHGNSGTLIVSDGFRYEGAWVDNAMEGRGIATYPNGQVYEGMWVAGRREGRGTIRFTNGAVYEGRFKDDNMEGQGTMKMDHNAIIPPHSDDEDSDNEKEKSNKKDDQRKNDWMIPIEFQSDIGHIHQKAGFTQVGL